SSWVRTAVPGTHWTRSVWQTRLDMAPQSLQVARAGQTLRHQNDQLFPLLRRQVADLFVKTPLEHAPIEIVPELDWIECAMHRNRQGHVRRRSQPHKNG